MTLAGGYGLAVTIQDPVEAMVWFFGAVLLVMVGTYCIFTAGSIALLKALRANHNFTIRRGTSPQYLGCCTG